MRKRTILVFIIAALLIAPAYSAPLTGGSTLISAPAATVNLIRNKAITNAEVDQRLQEYQAQGANLDRTQVLNLMINDEVFTQGAERDGITVTDMQIDSAISQVKQNIERQLGQSLSDAQFRELLTAQTGMSYEEYRNNARQSLLVSQYVMQEKGDELQSRMNAIEITDSQIETFYRRNRQQFYVPERVRLSQIFIEKTDNDAENSRNLATLTDVASRIKSGDITFERAVQDYSQDSSRSNGGDIGWLIMSDENTRTRLGDNFFYTCLSLDAGEVSDVIESTVGYHIVRASVHSDGEILGINDMIPPDNTVSLRETIANMLIQEQAATVQSEIINELVNELRSQARVRIY